MHHSRLVSPGMRCCRARIGRWPTWVWRCWRAPARAGEKIYHFGIGLTGRTLGSLGIGNIGAELFRITAPLGMRRIAADPYVAPDTAAALDVELVPVEQLLRESDFLCINTPLNAET